MPRKTVQKQIAEQHNSIVTEPVPFKFNGLIN